MMPLLKKILSFSKMFYYYRSSDITSLSSKQKNSFGCLWCSSTAVYFSMQQHSLQQQPQGKSVPISSVAGARRKGFTKDLSVKYTQ
jgi:hypothetical protein